MSFAVVEFKGSNNIAVVPSCWTKTHNNKIFSAWPDHLNKFPSKIRKAIKCSQGANEKFTTYEIDILKSFDQLEEAKLYERKIEDERYSSTASSQKSLGRGKRKKIINNKFKALSSTSESDTDTTSDLSFSHGASSSPKQYEESSIINRANTFAAKPSSLHTKTSVLTDNEEESISLLTRTGLLIKRPENQKTADSKRSENECEKWTLDIVVKNQIKIMATLANIEKKLVEVVHTKTSLGNSPENLPVQLPLENILNVEIFEDFLQNDDNLKAMLTYMKGFCGTNHGQSVNTLLKELLTDAVAGQYNYFGKKPKKKFSGTRTDKLMYLTVRHVFKMSREEYRKYAMKWLKYAPQRLKYAQKRSEDEIEDCSILNNLL